MQGLRALSLRQGFRILEGFIGSVRVLGFGDGFEVSGSELRVQACWGVRGFDLSRFIGLRGPTVRRVSEPPDTRRKDPRLEALWVFLVFLFRPLRGFRVFEGVFRVCLGFLLVFVGGILGV